ncbi:hypothetical protein ABW22_05445 [Thiobacillus denitrificans]|uniref:Uncharacterized protein n=1 Tax=Thiobacillus denitrificans TaxID=36861 RepID=A0A106BQY6_THIDE|nr:hypothetical protein ABW22_05445 [Thiobacillus denitrificans]
MQQQRLYKLRLEGFVCDTEFLGTFKLFFSIRALSELQVRFAKKPAYLGIVWVFLERVLELQDASFEIFLGV